MLTFFVLDFDLVDFTEVFLVGDFFASTFLLAAGSKGKRFSLPNSRIMVHQPSAGFQGQATDIEIHAKEVLDLKNRLNEIYSKHTGKSVEDIKSALERDNFMTADVAKEFGLVDQVVEKRS